MCVRVDPYLFLEVSYVWGRGYNFLCQLLINVLNAQQGYNFKEILAYDSICSVENKVEFLKR